MTIPPQRPAGALDARVGGGPPAHSPSLSAEEAPLEWEDLRRWVEQYRQRYPIVPALPECWWRHNNIVELLAALRDHERFSYGRAAPGTAGMEWQRARQQAELQLEFWIKRLPCGTPGRGHPPLAGVDISSEWNAHVQQDIERRRAES